MKKNITKIVLLVTALAVTSCGDDRFNILPNHQDTPAAVFTAESNYRSVVDGAYDYLREIYTGDNGNMLVVGDALADNLILSKQGRFSNADAYNWSFTALSSPVTSLYSTSYRTISRANLVLDNLNKVPYTDFMKNIEAEARGIRAISHFEIVRAYSKIPTQSADALNSMGIAYVTNFDPAMRPSRDATVKETYDKIIQDLEFAKDNINTTNGVGRLNKASIYGYLSKVYLYLGDYDKSASYGEECIKLAPSVGALNNVANIWKDASEDGLLLSLRNANLSSDNSSVGVGFNQAQSGIRSEFYVDYGLLQQYKNNDVRKSAYFITAPFNKVNYNHVIKYTHRASSITQNIVNVKILRAADIYLTTAEAHHRISNSSRALELLNTLRAQRYEGYTNGAESGDALLEAILHERRLEMFAENDRFWTLKRLGQDVVRSNYGSDVDGTGTDIPTDAIKTLPKSSHRFVLPIPDGAIRINPNIKQNPNY